MIGSAVDAAVAMRPRPADFARWAKRGIEGWSDPAFSAGEPSVPANLVRRGLAHYAG